MLWIAKRKGSEKERLLACRKKQLSSAVRKVFYKRKRFCFTEKAFFSAHARPTGKEKSFFQYSKIPTFHRAQTNVQLQILTAKTYCELAAKQPIFETSQSCVSSTASLSHRFKSSPAIPGNLAVFCAAGYMMMACHFSENHESSGDLNRRSQDGVPRAFWLLFARCKK